jgi:hypothetical protein
MNATIRSMPTVCGALLAVAAVSACGRDTAPAEKEREPRNGTGLQIATGTNDSTALDGATAKITSTDGKVTLAVVRDSVVMQLSDSLRRSVQATVDSSMKAERDGGGMGSSIANMVGGVVSKAVSGAMGVALRAPASQVTDLRYENGRLYFKVDGANMKFSTHGTGSNDGALFAEADARQFIAAVEAAKARQVAM